MCASPGFGSFFFLLYPELAITRYGYSYRCFFLTIIQLKDGNNRVSAAEVARGLKYVGESMSVEEVKAGLLLLEEAETATELEKNVSFDTFLRFIMQVRKTCPEFGRAGSIDPRARIREDAAKLTEQLLASLDSLSDLPDSEAATALAGLNRLVKRVTNQQAGDTTSSSMAPKASPQRLDLSGIAVRRASLVHVEGNKRGSSVWAHQRELELQRAAAVRQFREQLDDHERRDSSASSSWQPTLAGLIEVFCPPVGPLRRKQVKSVYRQCDRSCTSAFQILAGIGGGEEPVLHDLDDEGEEDTEAEKLSVGGAAQLGLAATKLKLLAKKANEKGKENEGAKQDGEADASGGGAADASGGSGGGASRDAGTAALNGFIEAQTVTDIEAEMHKLMAAAALPPAHSQYTPTATAGTASANKPKVHGHYSALKDFALPRAAYRHKQVCDYVCVCARVWVLASSLAWCR
jgi:hypothetical protein